MRRQTFTPVRHRYVKDVRDRDVDIIVSVLLYWDQCELGRFPYTSQLKQNSAIALKGLSSISRERYAELRASHEISVERALASSLLLLARLMENVLQDMLQLIDGATDGWTIKPIHTKNGHQPLATPGP